MDTVQHLCLYNTCKIFSTVFPSTVSRDLRTRTRLYFRALYSVWFYEQPVYLPINYSMVYVLFYTRNTLVLAHTISECSVQILYSFLHTNRWCWTTRLGYCVSIGWCVNDCRGNSATSNCGCCWCEEIRTLSKKKCKYFL